jgi:tetratricopeptide (TPR) repeat protein
MAMASPAGAALAPGICILFILTSARLCLCGEVAPSLDPFCDAINRDAKTLLAEGRGDEVEKRLSAFLTRPDNSRDADFCRGVTSLNLTYAFERSGKVKEAEAEANRSLELFEAAAGSDAALRRALLAVADIEICKRNFSRAARLVARADHLQNPSHTDLALIHAAKALLLSQQNRLQEAEGEFIESLGERNRSGEARSPDAIPDMCNLASLYLIRGRSAEAVTLLEEVERILDETPPDDRRRVQTDLILADAYARSRRTQEAEYVFRRAHSIVAARPPALDPDLSRYAELQYATFLRRRGRKREARDVKEQAEARYGKDLSLLTVSADTLLSRAR